MPNPLHSTAVLAGWPDVRNVVSDAVPLAVGTPAQRGQIAAQIAAAAPDRLIVVASMKSNAGEGRPGPRQGCSFELVKGSTPATVICVREGSD